MSISINSWPENPAPVYSPFYYQITSTNQNSSQFKFIAEIRVHSLLTSDSIGYFKFPLRPDGFGLFDPHRVLESYVHSVFTPTTTTVANASGSSNVYAIYFG